MARYSRDYIGERRTCSVGIKLTPTEKLEFEAAARALDLRENSSTTPVLQEAIRRLREHVPGWTKDCVLSVPIKNTDRFIAAGLLNGIEVPSVVTA